MKRNKRSPEQVNSVVPPEPVVEESFTLEDILREFGTKPAPSQPSPAPVPAPAAQAVETEKPSSAPVRKSPRQTPPPPVEPPPESKPDEIDLWLESVPKPRPLHPKPSPEPPAQSAPERKAPPTLKPATPPPIPEPAVPKPAVRPATQAPPKPTASRASAPTPVQPRTAAPKPTPPAKAVEPQVKKNRKKATPPAQKPKPASPPPEQLRRDCAKKLGTSRLRLALCMLLTLVQLCLVIYQEYQFNWIPVLSNLRTVVTVSIILWAICVLLSYDVLVKGFEQLFRLHIGLETLCAIATVLVAIDAVNSLQQEQMPYCAISALGLTFALWGLSDNYLGRLHTLRIVQTAEDPKAVREVSDAWNGKSGLFRSQGNTEQFMEQLEQPDLTTRAMRFYAPAALVLSLGVSAFFSANGNLPFVRAWMILLLGATPLCGFLSYSRPFSLLARRLSKCGGAICGWAGVKIFSGRHILLLHDEDVFPIANISLNGVKLYGGYPMERVISYAAAVTSACGSTLAPIFEEYRAQQNCRHYPVGLYRYYEVGGVGAEVMDDVVLMGSLRFMNSMGVHMDAGMKVKQAVYLSINGELACVFAMKYKPSPSAASGLSAIVRNGHFDTVLATRDFLVTPDYLRYKYGIPADNFIYPSVKERLRLSEQDLTDHGEQGALLLKDSFAAFAHTVCGGRTLRTCVQIGTAVDLVAGIAGLVLMILLLWLDAMATASVFNLALFLLAWALPGLLLSRWTRRA